jgi:hypothetical protein
MRQSRAPFFVLPVNRSALISSILALLCTSTVCFAQERYGFSKRVEDPLGDYIPCTFSAQQRAQFKGRMLKIDEAARSVVRALRGPAAADGAFRQQLDKFTISGRTEEEVSGALEALLPRQSDRTVAKTRLAQIAAPLETPDDVSCSMSLMSWDEVHDNFGRRIANQYAAFQVNVRNLNPQNEFLVHDVQIAIDPAVLGVACRKKAGASQGGHPGKGAASPVANQASGPGASPDNPANCASSSDDPGGGGNRFVSTRDKSLVRGVATVGQIQDPRNFALRLAEAIGSIAASVSLPAVPLFKDATNIFQGAGIPAFRSALPDMTVGQMSRLDDAGFSARANNRVLIGTRGSTNFVTFIPVAAINEYGFLQSVYGDGSGGSQKLIAQSNRKAVTLKGWPPQALAALQSNSYVVVAGVHIKEASKDDISVNGVDCGQKGGVLDTAKLTSGDCQVSGANLHLAAAIILKSASDSTGAGARAVLTTSGDPTVGTAQFKVEDLQALSGPYEVYWTAKNGAEQATHVLLSIKGKDAQTGKDATGRQEKAETPAKRQSGPAK